MPLREPIGRFANGTVRGIDPEAGAYFRDVGDHLARTAETVDELARTVVHVVADLDRPSIRRRVARWGGRDASQRNR